MHTCLVDPLLEPHYTKFATLTPFLSEYFQLEAARFSFHQEVQIQCLGKSITAATERWGLVRSWCERKTVEENWLQDVSMWLRADHRNFLCAAHGVFMDVFRGG